MAATYAEIVDGLKRRRAQIIERVDELVSRSITATEDRELSEIQQEYRRIEDRILELAEQALSEARAAQHRVETAEVTATAQRSRWSW